MLSKWATLFSSQPPLLQRAAPSQVADYREGQPGGGQEGRA